MAGRSWNGSSNGRSDSRSGRPASTSSRKPAKTQVDENQLALGAFLDSLPPPAGQATERGSTSSPRRPVQSDSPPTRNLVASMALQRWSSTGSSGGALHSDDTSVPGRPPPSPCTTEPSGSEYSSHDILPPNTNQNQSASHARSSPIAGRTRSKSPTKPTPSQDTLSSSVLQGRFQQQPFVDGPSSTNPSSPNTSLPEQPNQLEKRARSLSQVTRSKRPQSSRKYRQSKLATSSSHVSTASSSHLPWPAIRPRL